MRMTMLMLAGASWAVGLAAQQPTAPAWRWSVAATAGPILGGPAASVFGSLDRIGWGGTAPAGCFIFCWDPIEYPMRDAGASGEVTVRYALTNRWAISAGTTWNLQLGSAHGYREGPPNPYGFDLGDRLDSHFEGKSTWIAGHIEAAGRLSAGGGVALHSINNRDDASSSTASRHHRLGLLGEAGIRLPRATRVFWALTFRAHWIPGSVQFGERGSATGTSVPLDVSLSYATITTGVGVRF